MDWDKLRVFHAVAEAGSVTHAGETLHLSQSAVSRQIQGLEDALGAKLFHRHARGLLLTSEGEILFEATKDISANLSDAAQRLRENREGVHGPLRVTTTIDFGVLWLIPRLAKLLERHPGLMIELSLTEDVLDLPMRDADVAVRMRPPRQADVIGTKLWTSRVGLYASPDYIAARGNPEALEDLVGHDLIIYSPKAPQPSVEMDWLFRDPRGGPGLRPRVTLNTQYAVRESARYGAGIAVLPDFLAQDSGLERVAPSVSGPEITPHLVYSQEMRDLKRIRVFREFLLEELEAEAA